MAALIIGAGEAPPGGAPAAPPGAAKDPTRPPPKDAPRPGGKDSAKDAPGATAPPGPPRDRDRGREPGEGGRPGRRFAPENLTAEEIDEVIEVAAEISPEWGRALRARRDEDPQGLREAIASGGPRLVALSVLKRTHPELYAIRIEDLRLQNDLKALARDYRTALEAGGAQAAELEATLRQKIGRQVDLDLRARAIELKALDAQLRQMVDELTQEARERTARVDKVLESIKAGEEPKPLVRPGLGGGMRGFRRPGGPEGRNGREMEDGRPGGPPPRTPRPEAPGAAPPMTPSVPGTAPSAPVPASGPAAPASKP